MILLLFDLKEKVINKQSKSYIFAGVKDFIKNISETGTLALTVCSPLYVLGQINDHVAHLDFLIEVCSHWLRVGEEVTSFLQLFHSVLCASAVVILGSAVLGFSLLIDECFRVFPVAGCDVALSGYFRRFVSFELSFAF